MSWSKRTTKERPPLKSTPCFSPIEKIEIIPPIIIAPEMIYAILRFFRNSTFILLNHPLDTVVLKVNLEFLFTAPSINKRVINTAVNKEVAIPIINVNAKPLMGPVPKTYKIIPVKSVVMFASIIADKAPFTENPSSTDCFKPFFLNKLSFILSKIITFASTDIPMVNMIPAIPGNVNTALKEAKIPKINKMFTANAMSANNPAFP